MRSQDWAHLGDQLNYEIHHELGFFVEHALPKLIHHTLCEVEHIVDQDLVTSSCLYWQWCLLTCWKTKSHTHEIFVILADIVEFWIFCWTTDFKGHQGTLDQKLWEPLKYGHVSPYHDSFCIYCAWSTLTSKTTQFGRKWDWVNDSIFIFWQFPELNLMTGIATNPTEHLLPEAAPSHCPGCRTETLSAGSWLSALVRPEDTEQS